VHYGALCISNPTRARALAQSIEFGADFGPALEHLLACYPDYATVGELPELEPEDAAELAQALLEAGLLRFE
jgi:hypothetical protein